ncbi:hypothetical protein N431DRAFT_461138 [Stipitochalara longipes BDJ]|nr:hypothetical protein N431DRAFT_461138 [Stipitochalara longipes BDJ]
METGEDSLNADLNIFYDADGIAWIITSTAFVLLMIQERRDKFGLWHFSGSNYYLFCWYLRCKFTCSPILEFFANDSSASSDET